MKHIIMIAYMMSSNSIFSGLWAGCLIGGCGVLGQAVFAVSSMNRRGSSGLETNLVIIYEP